MNLNASSRIRMYLSKGLIPALAVHLCRSQINVVDAQDVDQVGSAQPSR